MGAPSKIIRAPMLRDLRELARPSGGNRPRSSRYLPMEDERAKLLTYAEIGASRATAWRQASPLIRLPKPENAGMWRMLRRAGEGSIASSMRKGASHWTRFAALTERLRRM